MFRIKALDGLRGIAVIMVILFHLLNNSYQNSNFEKLNGLEISIMKITSFGWAGVNLFFVLSGFLIGTILISKKESINFFKVFFIRRFLRILPLYFLFIIVYLCFKYFLFNDKLALFEKPIPIFAYFILIQNFIMSNLGNFGPNALTPTWSLAVEEQFYLIIPFIIYFTNRKQLFLVSISLIIFAQYYRITSGNWHQEYTHFLSRMDAPFLGILLALGRNSENRIIGFIKKWKNKFIIFLILFLLYIGHHSFNHFVISFIFLIIIDWLLDIKENSLILDIISQKWILLVGKYSFFLYLFHQLINGVLFAVFEKNRNPNLNSIGAYFLEIFAVLLTLVLAHISYRLFESKMINLGKRFTYLSKSQC